MKRFKKKKEHTLDEQIERLLGDMKCETTGGDNYEVLLDRLDSLMKMKHAERRAPVSMDTIAIVVGNLAGILIIVVYEQNHPMISKAFGNIIKPKA